MKHDINQYRYVVVWSESEKEFLGTCTEFPLLSHFDETQEKALAGIKDLVQGVIEDMVENKEKVPQPHSTRKYSGKLNLRMSEEQHRELSIQAIENGVSLNSLILQRLGG